MSTTVTRSEKLDLRLTPDAKRTLQTAAAAANRSVSDFVLESALERAAEALPDRTRFLLGPDVRTGVSCGRSWLGVRDDARSHILER